MAMSGKERTKKFETDQAKRGLAPTPRGWVPMGEVHLVKALIDRLRKAHQTRSDIQRE